LVVDVDGAGQRVGLGVALDDGDGNAAVGEQQRGGAADRAGADDDDVSWIHGGFRHGSVGIVRATPATASRTRSGSPATVTTSRPFWWLALTARTGMPASASASQTAR